MFPELAGMPTPLLLYADDHVLVATNEAGQQRQLDVLADFCGEQQLTVNFSKTKAVTFETIRSECADLAHSELCL